MLFARGRIEPEPPAYSLSMCGLPAAALPNRPCQKITQLGTRRRHFADVDRRTRPNHNINTGNRCTGMSENIPREPLEGITRNGPLRNALADHYAQAGFQCAARTRIHLKPLPAHPAFVSEYRGVSMRPVEAPSARKGEILAAAQFLNGQTRATFRATGANDRAACPGFHADAESMRTFAPCRRWLISPFHDLDPVNVTSPLLQPLTPVFVNVNLIGPMSGRRPRLLVDNSPQKR